MKIQHIHSHCKNPTQTNMSHGDSVFPIKLWMEDSNHCITLGSPVIAADEHDMNPHTKDGEVILGSPLEVSKLNAQTMEPSPIISTRAQSFLKMMEAV